MHVSAVASLQYLEFLKTWMLRILILPCAWFLHDLSSSGILKDVTLLLQGSEARKCAAELGWRGQAE